MENPIKMDDLGIPLFLETPIRRINPQKWVLGIAERMYVYTGIWMWCIYIYIFMYTYIYIWRITIYFFNGNILSLKIAPNCSWNPGFTQALFICKISMKTFKNSFENKSRKNRTSEGARLAPGTAPAGVLDSTLAIESWRGRCKLVSLQIPKAF